MAQIAEVKQLFQLLNFKEFVYTVKPWCLSKNVLALGYLYLSWGDISHIDMCRPKGYGFCTVLVLKRL